MTNEELIDGMLEAAIVGGGELEWFDGDSWVDPEFEDTWVAAMRRVGELRYDLEARLGIAAAALS